MAEFDSRAHTVATNKIEHYQQVKRITILGAWLNVLLGLLKIVIGYLGYSQALIADGIHSLSDLLTDALVVFAAKFGSKKPDSDHPYGHGRIETVATIIVAIILIGVAVGITYAAVMHLLEETVSPLLPETSVIIVAFIGLAIKEYLFRYTLKTATSIDSNLLRASAWHHRSDVVSSLIVLFGIVGARVGFHALDAIAAIIMALLILKMAGEMIWVGLRELVDTGVDETMLTHIHEQIIAVPGVKSLHQLRTRSIAGAIYIDIHVLVNPWISVSEGHYISEQVYLALGQRFTKIADVIVHIDVENDEAVQPSLNLPSRSDLEQQCRVQWCNLPAYQQIHKIVLHYLAGKISIEIFMPMSVLTEQLTTAELTKQYYAAVRELDCVRDVRIYFS